jgi:hypothetical protein
MGSCKTRRITTAKSHVRFNLSDTNVGSLEYTLIVVKNGYDKSSLL